MEDLEFLEKTLEEEKKKKMKDIDKFISDKAVIELIKKYVMANMNDDEIIASLNLLLKNEDIRKRYNITKRILIRKKHIKAILSEAKKMKKNVNKTNLTNQTNQTKQTNQPNQTNFVNQPNQTNFVKQPNQPNLTNQPNQTKQTNQTNQSYDEKIVNPIKRNTIKL